jgi:hypothetical protein
VTLFAALIAIFGLGVVLGRVWGQGKSRPRIRDLEARLRLIHEQLSTGRLKHVDPHAHRRLTLITSNVRNGVQRGK